MTDIAMRRTLEGFAPANQAEWDKLRACHIKIGDLAKCALSKPRNYAFHCKYFAMIGEAFEMQDMFDNPDVWREAVLIATGHCDTYINHLGNVSYKAKSISFAKVDDIEFSKIYNNTIQAIVDRWLKSEPDQYKLILGYM